MASDDRWFYHKPQKSKETMSRESLPDEVWLRLEPILKNFRIHFSKKVRHFIEAVTWKLRTGAPWRDLPKQFGSHSTIFNRFNRWSQNGLWQKLFMALRVDVDDEWNFMDGTIMKAHQHASGAASREDEGIGKSVGGNTTKVHMLADAHGNPIDFVITGGQVHDAKMAPVLIEISQAENLMADKAYHSQNIRQKAESKGIQVIIPVKSNSVDKSNPGFDGHLYKQRHLIENLFARLKHFRSIATRYEKKKMNYASMLYLAGAYIWSKV